MAAETGTTPRWISALGQRKHFYGLRGCRGPPNAHPETGAALAELACFLLVLACLDLIPQLLIDDLEIWYVVDDPFGVRIETRDALVGTKWFLGKSTMELARVFGNVAEARRQRDLVPARQFYDFLTPFDPPLGPIAAIISAWTVSSCAFTAAISDNRRCRES
jgi:hypothetical protein